MAQQKVPMPERDPKERARCFQEVAMGYTPEQAIEEAGRCTVRRSPASADVR